MSAWWCSNKSTNFPDYVTSFSGKICSGGKATHSSSFLSLRYKYENNKIVEDAHSGTDGGGARSALVLLRERQKAHIDQFMRTEKAYTQAEESKRGTEEVMRGILEACAKSGTQETILEVTRCRFLNFQKALGSHLLCLASNLSTQASASESEDFI